jgi:hypothetical protein
VKHSLKDLAQTAKEIAKANWPMSTKPLHWYVKVWVPSYRGETCRVNQRYSTEAQARDAAARLVASSRVVTMGERVEVVRQ